MPEEVQIQVNFRSHSHQFRMKIGRWRKLRDGISADQFADLMVKAIESQILLNPVRMQPHAYNNILILFCNGSRNVPLLRCNTGNH